MTLKLQKNDAPAGPYDNSNVNNRISHKFSSYVLIKKPILYLRNILQSCTIQVFPHTICFQNPAQF